MNARTSLVRVDEYWYLLYRQSGTTGFSLLLRATIIATSGTDDDDNILKRETVVPDKVMPAFLIRSFRNELDTPFADNIIMQQPMVQVGSEIIYRGIGNPPTQHQKGLKPYTYNTEHRTEEISSVAPRQFPRVGPWPNESMTLRACVFFENSAAFGLSR